MMARTAKPASRAQGSRGVKERLNSLICTYFNAYFGLLASKGQALPQIYSPPTKKSFILAKKPEDSGCVLCRRFGFEFGEQFALALGQVLRRLDIGLDVEVADVARAQNRHALALAP